MTDGTFDNLNRSRGVESRLSGAVGPDRGQTLQGGMPPVTSIRTLSRSPAVRGSPVTGCLVKKILFCLLPMATLTLGEAAHSQEPTPAPSILQTIMPTVKDDALGNAAQGNPSPSPAPSDWTPPSELQQLQTVQTEPQLDGTAQMPTLEVYSAADTSATDAAADDKLAPRVDLGGPGTPKWKVVTYVSQTTTIDDNIYISNSNKQSDVYFTLSPGFAAGWGDFRSVLLGKTSTFSDEYVQTRMPLNEPTTGDYAFMNYTANATHFLSHDSADAVDQDAEIKSQWAFSKTILGLNAQVQELSGPEVDLGMRTRRTIFTIDATANYTVSDKTSFDFDAGGTVRRYASELSSSELHGQAFMNYQWAPKTSIGVGVAAGLRQLDTTPDQYYQQGLLRASYNATERLSINLNGGIEVDEASGGSTQLNPVFGLGASYNIDAQDDLGLNASRSTSSSAVTTGETTETTAVNIEFRRRIYASFSFAFSLGYQNLEFYDQALSTLARTDNYIFLRPSVTYSFAEWSQLELAYEYHRDVSSQRSFDFGENVASLELNLIF